MRQTRKIFAHYLTRMLIMASFITLPALLSGCGFQLRGYESPITYTAASTLLVIEDNTTSLPLKTPLTQNLNALDVNVVDEIGHKINNSKQQYTAIIKVDNVHFKKYKLVGVLTEIRLVLTADVTYQTKNNKQGVVGDTITVKNPVQVESSYQFNEASVSVEDQQGEQVRDWLYDNLAQRIADQYVALSLPRVPASQ